MNVTQLQTQITQVEAQLAALNTAILARLDPTTRSYTLDTSQSNQSWSGMTITELNAAQDKLMNRLCSLQNRLTGGGALLGVPAW